MAELTIQRGDGSTETFTVVGAGSVVSALAQVTTAAWAVHRNEAVATYETMQEAMRRAGLGAFVRTTPVQEVAPHGFEACTDPDCPWHRDGRITPGFCRNPDCVCPCHG